MLPLIGHELYTKKLAMNCSWFNFSPCMFCARQNASSLYPLKERFCLNAHVLLLISSIL